MFVGSGGGLSLYEPEPAYQPSVEYTGNRITLSLSPVADPA
jgi:subtilase family serine protease